MNQNVKTSAYIAPLAKNLRNNMIGSENKEGLNNIYVVRKMILRLVPPLGDLTCTHNSTAP
jgi:hypothetical protein